MKKVRIFFAYTIKILFIFLLLSVILLAIGVSLPKQAFYQKKEITNSLIIKDCSVVDVKNGVIKQHQNVGIKDGQIAFLDTTTQALPTWTGAKIVDGQGKYIMPSLWDMHLHTLSLSPQLHFPLLIANGVTGVRDMGDGDSWISNIDDNSIRDKAIWEQQSRENNLLMPNIVEACSYHVEEIEGANAANYKVQTEDLVKKLKARNEPFIKLQLENSELPDSIFYAILEQAKKHNIKALGHLLPTVDINKIIDLDYASIEHAWALIPHFSSNKKHFKRDMDNKIHELATQDSSKARDILSKIAQKNIYYVPTHVTSNRKEYLAFDKKFRENAHNQYVESTQLVLWNVLNWVHTKGYDEATDKPILENYYKRGLEVTQLAQTNGVKILAGTDALDRNVYYGFSLHDELKELVKAGLTTAEALTTATLNATDYYGISDKYGSIDKGKVADFIILSANPLENIENTQAIESVYYNNRLYEKSDLEEMKSFVKEQAKSFGIHCKFVWNMIKGI